MYEVLLLFKTQLNFISRAISKTAMGTKVLYIKITNTHNQKFIEIINWTLPSSAGKTASYCVENWPISTKRIMTTGTSAKWGWVFPVYRPFVWVCMSFFSFAFIFYLCLFLYTLICSSNVCFLFAVALNTAIIWTRLSYYSMFIILMANCYPNEAFGFDC